MNIYVGNLNFRLAESELIKMFALFGEVGSVKIIHDRDTGRSKGYAFVEMPNEDDGRRAILNLNDTEVMERRIVVNEAKPPSSFDRKPGGFNRGGSGGSGGGYGGGGYGGGGGGGYKKPYGGGGGGGDRFNRGGGGGDRQGGYQKPFRQGPPREREWRNDD